MKIAEAVEKFVKSDAFASGVVSSTIAEYGGSGYSAEIFEDGTFRILWNNSIGNMYCSAGVIIPLPQLDTEDMVNGEAGNDPNCRVDLDEAFSWQADEMVRLFLASAFDK